MGSGRLRVAVVCLLLCAVCVRGFHTPLDELVKYPHCWPLDADQDNDEPVDCKGLIMEWETRPSTLKTMQGDTIRVAINITASDSTLTGSLAALCKQDCPSDCNVNAENCCVWHADLHACFPNSIREDTPACVPWNEENVIQSEAKCGPFGSYNASLELYQPGITALMYHLQVGNLSMALGDYVLVNPARCGDGMCQRVEVCNNCPEKRMAEEGQEKKRGVPCTVCPKDCCQLEIILGSSLGFLFIIISIPVGITVCIYLWIFHRKKKRMEDESWIISYSDIITNPGRKAMSSLVSLNKKKDNTSSLYCSALDLQTQQVFTEMGSLNGKTVAIRRVKIKRTVFGGCGSISSQLRKEVFQIRYLEHQNLCKFIGATVKDPPPNVAIICEYCSKGSLNDVLLNDDIPLNWNFRFSFAGDIARGMAYLHSHGITHGRLTSSNCVIDDRWVTKVTDYGLPGLRCHEVGAEGEETGGQPQRHIPKVYHAPEVRDLSPLKISSSPPADVYSYAIILYEIATGMDPRSEDMWSLDTNCKPRISQKQLSETECPCSQDYLNLINKCWTFSPQTRLTFDRVKKEIRKINPSNTSAIDNMMHMMEKYSKHLEQLVNERTAELEEEKERATDLLYRMIPQAVAEELKNGKNIKAEEFEGVTIFFSDIVGFTNLAGSSSPMQIVGLLNKLYTEFDRVLDQFDVYKVETIGDAYMVVSGVPRTNGDLHAGEIAKMALKLMACCESFTIPHRPDMQLQIRAGIHSGSVCAGVVGQKMPRYCLFGDTVNTASRMENTSIAMHIQCSEATYQLLDKLGGFTLENRGVIEVKGKGLMNTWWLKDYTEPEIEILPPPPPPPLQEDTFPTTMEPIRDAPKKTSSVEMDRSADQRGSTGSLTRGGPSSSALDVFKRHQSLHTGSFSNLLSTEEGERLGREKMVTPKRSITMPREVTSSGSATELTRRPISPNPPAPRHSLPQITVKTFPSGGRRVTQPNMESVGLVSGRAREEAGRKISHTSVTSRENTAKQPSLSPLDGSNDTEF